MITHHRPNLPDTANRFAGEVDWYPHRWPRAWRAALLFALSAGCWAAVIGLIVIVAALR